MKKYSSTPFLISKLFAALTMLLPGTPEISEKFVTKNESFNIFEIISKPKGSSFVYNGEELGTMGLRPDELPGFFSI